MYNYEFKAGDRVIKIEPEKGQVGLRIMKPSHGRGVVVKLDPDMVGTLSETLILARKQAEGG